MKEENKKTKFDLHKILLAKHIANKNSDRHKMAEPLAIKFLVENDINLDMPTEEEVDQLIIQLIKEKPEIGKKGAEPGVFESWSNHICDLFFHGTHSQKQGTLDFIMAVFFNKRFVFHRKVFYSVPIKLEEL